jgi:hypothetical protein
MLSAIFLLLQEKGVHLVVAQVLEDVEELSRYHLKQLFGKDAFYDTLQDVLNAYQTQVSAAAK